MTEFHPREIALNWYGEGPEGEGHGHCRGCEHRDGDLCSSPVYGYWTGDSPQTEVMLLGEAPGGNSGNGRQKVDSSDQYDNEYIEKNQKGKSWSDPWDREKNRGRDLKYVLKNSDIKIPVDFVERVQNKYDSQIYFTNMKKCNDASDAEGEEYEKAR